MGDIYVNAAAPAGGDGRTPATAYRTIAAAVNDANARVDGATVHVAAGDYVEAVGATTVEKPNVRILGSTVLSVDARGIPTGEVANAARWTSATQGTLLKVHAPHFELAGMVLDGGTPRPPSLSQNAMLFVDGSVAPGAFHSLEDVSIHGNCIQDSLVGVSLRRASATVDGNYIARNGGGFQCLAGFRPDAEHEGTGQTVVFTRNRVEDNVNLGATFSGHPGSNMPPQFPARDAFNRVVVEGNDFVGNGDARDPRPDGTYYPQPIQYTGLLFLVMHGGSSDATKDARVEATIRDNTFRRNGYGMAVGQRIPKAVAGRGYSFVATLSGNRYCANGLNDLFVDFCFPAQSHLGSAGQPTRYAMETVHDIDARGDGLTLDDVDYDHPETDPRFPESDPGTVALGNTFRFNGETIPPLPTHDAADPPPRVTRPPLLSTDPDVFAPISTADRKPPRIRGVTATPDALWPADRKMVPVTVAVDAHDGCDLHPRCEIVTVKSNEPIHGPGAPEPDWELTGLLSLRLRAARSGTGPGRIYTIGVRCTDQSGNASTASVRVTVPHHPS